MDPSILSLILLVGICSCSNPDDALPVYLRGMNWDRVEKHATEDLSLSDAVSPINYGIELSVNVRGHEGAERSDFNGTVYITLNIHRPINSVEVHSNGLNIDRADFIDIVIFSEPVGVSKISFDSERETMTVFANRTIKPSEEFILKITYRGIAKMSDYGLFESWDPKFNKSLDSNGPFILASNNFPTGARFWFPCFDEPAKRATFELQVTHSSGLNVYSNTGIARTEMLKDGRTRSVFSKTRLLSTYQVALSVNHLAVQSFDAEQFGNVRVISSSNSHPYTSHPSSLTTWLMKRFRVDIQKYFKHNLELLNNTTLENPKEKLDVIILEGTKEQFVHPGLMFIGRQRMFSSHHYQDEIIDANREFAQLLTGNRISVRNSNQMWMNRMFSYFLINEPEPSIELEYKKTAEFYHESLHERPLRDLMMHATSTRQFLASRSAKPAQKAAQLMRLLARVCPASAKAMQSYITDHTGSFADIDDFITIVEQACPNPLLFRAFLEGYIDQPGKPLLIVKRVNGTVSITQTRYHSSYFDKDLRDNSTRYTIPIRYKINGKNNIIWLTKNVTSASITVPVQSTFIVDHDLDHLYFVYYEDSLLVPGRKYSDAERLEIYNAARKASVAAFAIGYTTYDSVFERIKDYVENRAFTFSGPTSYSLIKHDLRYVMGRSYDCSNSSIFASMYIEDNLPDVAHYRESFCALRLGDAFDDAFRGDWNGFFNNATTYWLQPTHAFLSVYYNLECLSDFANASSYRRFLIENFNGEVTSIRPEQMPIIARQDTINHWRDAHRFFFRSVANSTDHRFNLLAEAILKSDYTSAQYPEGSIRDDYHRELRDFVTRYPRRAASMLTEIKMKLESEHIRCARDNGMMKSWDGYYAELMKIEKKFEKQS